MSALLIVRGRYYIAHIGDSRIYEIRRRKLHGRSHRVIPLTRDDKNEQGQLLRCLGVSGEDAARFTCGRIRRRSGFLLCTDGFYYVGEKRIGETLGPAVSGERRRRFCYAGRKQSGEESGKTAGISRRLELLGMQAEREGSRDNMAAVFVSAE